MSFSTSYFALENPLNMIDRWLNPYKQSCVASLRGNGVDVMWTNRADRKMQTLDKPLSVEMQLYFTCVVAKRVLFHQETDLDIYPVNNNLNIAFRLVQSTACDPIEFAANHPVKCELTDNLSKRVRPKKLKIDFQANNWVGVFTM